MSRRSIPMIEISEVMYQWQQGRSKNKIAESLGITRPTVRNYLKLAMAAGLTSESSPVDVSVIALSVILTLLKNVLELKGNKIYH